MNADKILVPSAFIGVHRQLKYVAGFGGAGTPA
jgi:hypothetical protein